MAVLDKVKGLTVEILVESVALPEYPDDDHTTPSRMSKFVEAQNSAQFVISCNTNGSFSRAKSILIEVRLDGVWATSRIVKRSDLKTAQVSRFDGPARSQLRFRFSALTISL